MKTLLEHYIACLLIALLACSCGVPPRRMAPPSSLTAPRAQLTDGSYTSLAAQSGKPTILVFWASWCGQCTHELPMFEHARRQLADQGLNILAVAINDDISEVQGVKVRLGLEFDVANDYQGEFESAFRVRGIPEVMFLGTDGRPQLFRDPASGEPINRAIGVREWDSPEGIAVIKEFLEQNNRIEVPAPGMSA